MCIQFVKRTGDYDFHSESINFTLNATLYTLAGVGLGTIAAVACKSLGLAGISNALVAVIPIAAIVGLSTAAVVGCFAGITICVAAYRFRM